MAAAEVVVAAAAGESSSEWWGRVLGGWLGGVLRGDSVGAGGTSGGTVGPVRGATVSRGDGAIGGVGDGGGVEGWQTGSNLDGTNSRMLVMASSSVPVGRPAISGFCTSGCRSSTSRS